MADTRGAETITAREANQQFSRLLAEVASGRSFVITRRGVPVARLTPEPAPDGRRRLTPEQEKAWAETLEFIATLKPQPPPEDLPPGWPRSRDDLYAERLGLPFEGEE
jgi:prevent-host-death family protein